MRNALVAGVQQPSRTRSQHPPLPVSVALAAAKVGRKPRLTHAWSEQKEAQQMLRKACERMRHQLIALPAFGVSTSHIQHVQVCVCVCVCARARVCPCPARTIRSRRREEVEPMEPWRRRLGRCLAIEEPPVRTRNMLSRCVAMLSRLRFSATQPRPGSRRDLCCRASRRKASRCRRQGFGPRTEVEAGCAPAS